MYSYLPLVFGPPPIGLSPPPGAATATSTAAAAASPTATATSTAAATATATATATASPTATATAAPDAPACAPISALGCADVAAGVPLSLRWDVDQAGLADRAGLGTGFTMADSPSARLADDGPAAYADVPGYEPQLIAVDQATGTLVISSTKGIQFRDPSVSSGTNSQINALGVGLPAAGPLRISTTLVRPALSAHASAMGQQAGIWFGLDEDNYVKLVVLKSGGTTARVELAVERYDAEATGPAPLALDTPSSTISDPDSQEIRLFLEIDPVVRSARGFYQLNGGPIVQVVQGGGSSLSIPAAFLTGANHDNDPATEPLRYAGLFGTQRSAPASDLIGFAFRGFDVAAMAGAPLADPNAFSRIRWVPAAPQPFANAEGQSVALGDMIYSFGGFDSTKGCCTPTDRAYAFDPIANSWEPLAPLPYIAGNGTAGGGVTHAGIATDGAFIYLAAGYIAAAPGSGQSFGTRQAWRYDPATDSYARLPDLPADRAAGVLAVVGGELHYFGGTNKARTQDVGDHWALALAAGTTWEARAPLPNPRHHMAAISYGGKIYAIGGQHAHDGSLVPQATLNAYDPATNTWEELAPLPIPRNHMTSSTALMGDRIIVMGGQQEHNSPQTSVFAYAITTDVWDELTPLPEARHSAVGGVVGGRLYFSTGGTNKSWMGIPVTSGGPDSAGDVRVATAAQPAASGPANLFYCTVVEPRLCGPDCATKHQVDMW